MPTVDFILAERETEAEDRKAERQRYWDTLLGVRQQEQQSPFGFLVDSFAGPTERKQNMIERLRQLPTEKAPDGTPTGRRYYPVSRQAVEQVAPDRASLILGRTGLKDEGALPVNPAWAVIARETGFSDDEISLLYLVHGPDMGINKDVVKPEEYSNALRLQLESAKAGDIGSPHSEQLAPLELGKRFFGSMVGGMTLGKVQPTEPLPYSEKFPVIGMTDVDIANIASVAGVFGPATALGMVAGEKVGGKAGKQVAGEKGEQVGSLLGMFAGPIAGKIGTGLAVRSLPKTVRVPAPLGGFHEIPVKYPVSRIIAPQLAEAYRSGEVLGRQAAKATQQMMIKAKSETQRALAASRHGIELSPLSLEDRALLSMPGAPDPRYTMLSPKAAVLDSVTEAGSKSKDYSKLIGDAIAKSPVGRAVGATGKTFNRYIPAINPRVWRLYRYPEIETLIDSQQELFAREQMCAAVVGQGRRWMEKGVLQINPDTGEFLNPAKPLPEGSKLNWNDVLSDTKNWKYLSEDQLRMVNFLQGSREELLRIMQAKGISPKTLFEGAEGHSYLPRIVQTYDGVNQLQRLYRDGMLGRSPLFKSQRYYEWVEDALSKSTHEIKYLNDPVEGFKAWYEAANYTIFWEDFAKWLKQHGETPAARALAAKPELTAAYMASSREFTAARARLNRAKTAFQRQGYKINAEGVPTTPVLKRPTKKFTANAKKIVDEHSAAELAYKETRANFIDVKTKYKALVDQVRRPAEGERMMIDFKMGPRVFKEDLARQVRIMMGRNSGVIANGARIVNSFNNLFRPIMAVGDLSWWMIQGYLGVGGAEPAFLKGLGRGLGAMVKPDLYFERTLHYQKSGLLKRFFDGGGVWFGTDLPAEWTLPASVGRAFKKKFPGATENIERFASRKYAGVAPRIAGKLLYKGYPLKPFLEEFNRASNIAAIELFDSWSRLADDLMALDTANVGRGVELLTPKLRGVMDDLLSGKEPTFKPLKVADRPYIPTQEERLAQQFPLGSTARRSSALSRASTTVSGPVMGELRGASRAAIDHEIIAVVNKARGTINAVMLGMSPTQRALESSFLFAPRYFRAYMGLLSDAIQGGMRGNRARYFLARGMTGLVVDYTFLSKFVFGVEPDFDPSSPRFMTIPIANTHVGVGGGLYGLIRLGANINKASTFEDWLSIDTNPFTRRLRAMASPALGLLWDTMRGRNYVGEPLNNELAVARHAMISGLPFSIQSLIEEGPASAIATFAGARAFPVQGWEWRDYYRDLAAQEGFEKFGWRDEETGKPLTKWDQLNDVLRKQALTETPSGLQAKRWSEKWMKVAANQGKDWAQREQSYELFKGDKKAQLAQAILNMKKGEIQPKDVIKARQDIGVELQQRRVQLETDYPDTSGEPDLFLEDAYADLYLFLDADKDGDGVVSADEWRQNETEKETLIARAADRGIDLVEYANSRAGITWGHPVLDKFEREYQQAKQQRDAFYAIPRWQGFSPAESDKIDGYLRSIPAYQEKLQRSAIAAGYPPETVQEMGRATTREILKQRPPKGLNDREKLLFALALRLDSDKDLSEKLDGGVDSPRYKYLLQNPTLLQWFPKVGTALSVAERLALPQFNQQAEEIMAETRVATDTQTVQLMEQAIAEAESKARKH